MTQSIQLLRSLVLSMGAALVIQATALCDSNEIFPNAHNDPITVRIMNGKYGVPIGHAHLIVTGGYDERDIGLRLWREELLTDANGEVRLPNGLANLPLLQLTVAKHKLCQSHSKAAMFSVERMRRDGLSAPNRCGTATVEDAPGVFTVFVNGDNAAARAINNGLAVQTARVPAAVSQTPTPNSAVPTIAASAPLADRASDRKITVNDSDAQAKSSSPSDSAGSGSRSASAEQPAPALPPATGMDRFFFSNPPPAPTILPAPGQRAPLVVQIPSANSSATPSTTRNTAYPASAPDSILGSAEAFAKQAAQKTIQAPFSGFAATGQTEAASESPSASPETPQRQAKQKAAHLRSSRASQVRKAEEAANAGANKQPAVDQGKQSLPDAGKQPKPAAPNLKFAGTKPSAGTPANHARPDSRASKAKPRAAKSKKPASGTCEAPAKT